MIKPKNIDDPNEALESAEDERRAKKDLEADSIKVSFASPSVFEGEGYAVKEYPPSPVKKKETYAIFVKGGWAFPSLTNLSFNDRAAVLSYFSNAEPGDPIPEAIAALLPEGYDYRFGYFFNITIDHVHYSGFKALKERFSSLDEMKAAVEKYIKSSKKYTFTGFDSASHPA
jgi:hypothetical protein